MIVCNDLHKGFGDVKAVDGISFQVPDGTFLGLLGPNGAGKTTLMRMMTGLLAPDTGTVEFDNRLMDRNAIGVKQVIGVTSQHVNLDKELTVEENMEFAGRLYRMRRNEIAAAGQCQGTGSSGTVRRDEAQADDRKSPDPRSPVSVLR